MFFLLLFCPQSSALQVTFLILTEKPLSEILFRIHSCNQQLLGPKTANLCRYRKLHKVPCIKLDGVDWLIANPSVDRSLHLQFENSFFDFGCIKGGSNQSQLPCFNCLGVGFYRKIMIGIGELSLASRDSVATICGSFFYNLY